MLKKHSLNIALILLIIASGLVFPPVLKILVSGGCILKTFDFNPVFGPVNFVVDPISAFFILIILFFGTVSLIYAKNYLKPYILKGKSIVPNVIFFITLVFSMMGVVTCQNALFFLILWEIMSLSSFFLVIFENEKKEILSAGVKYLVFMHISVLFIIFAFALMAIKSGSLDFNAFAAMLKSPDNKAFSGIVFILAFIGFGIKAGFVPFHNWLPEAHPAAPSHVSAIMSGVMIKTGIYGIIRMIFLCPPPPEFTAYAVLIISVITALYGVLYAVGQSDFKKMLAYSSIENIGIIGIALGIAMIGLSYNIPAAAFIGFLGVFCHILNHAVFKELLFFGAGNVYLKTHTRDMEQLGGLVKKMPKTAPLFLIGSLSICALPPFNGFISEFLIYYGLLKALNINNFFNFVVLIFAIAGLALVGTIAILCFTKAFSVIFLSNPRSDAALNVEEGENPYGIFAMTILAAIALGIGLFPKNIVQILYAPSSMMAGFSPEISINLLNILKTVSLTAFGLLVFVVILSVIRFKLQKRETSSNTWGCGYRHRDEKRLQRKVQYTSSSYASPFLSMLKPLFKKVFDVKKPKTLFPAGAHFSLMIEDIEEAYLIKPVLKFDEWFLTKFEKIQDGNLQTYIKYGLVFLAISVFGGIFIW